MCVCVCVCVCADNSHLLGANDPSDFPALAYCLKTSIENTAKLKSDSELNRNDGKTELIWTDTKGQISQVNLSHIPMFTCSYDIPFSQSVRNIGSCLYEILSMDAHDNHPCHILSLLQDGNNWLLPLN